MPHRWPISPQWRTNFCMRGVSSTAVLLFLSKQKLQYNCLVVNWKRELSARGRRGTQGAGEVGGFGGGQAGRQRLARAVPQAKLEVRAGRNDVGHRVRRPGSDALA